MSLLRQASLNGCQHVQLQLQSPPTRRQHKTKCAPPLLLQGCGLPWDPPDPNFKPFYWKNYLAFYGALRAAHPALHLIANCHLGDLAPTDIWEYHVSSQWVASGAPAGGLSMAQPMGSCGRQWCSCGAAFEGFSALGWAHHDQQRT